MPYRSLHIKVLLIIGILEWATLATSFAADSEQGFKVGLGGQILIPLGVLSDNYNSGIGAHAQIKYILVGRVALGANLGFNVLRTRIPIIGGINTLRQIGIQVDYFFEQCAQGTFLTLELNRYFYRTTFAQNVGGISQGGSFSFPGVIGFSPGLGYLYQASDTMSYYGLIKYNWMPSIYPNTPAFQLVSIQFGILLGL